MTNRLIFVLLSITLIAALPVSGATVHDNFVYFENVVGTSFHFHVADRKITSGQPYDYTDSGSGDNEAWINVRAGRHGSDEVADWFNDKTHTAIGTRHSGDIGNPGQLNFAIYGDMRVVDDKRTFVCKDVVIGQGHVVGYNNWWIGGKHIQVRGNEAWLECPPAHGYCAGMVTLETKQDSSDTFELEFMSCPCSNLLSSVLPTSRSVQVGSVATAFAMAINTTSNTHFDCDIGLGADVMADFSFHTTDSDTNEVTGSRDTAVDIPAGQNQSYVVSITPTAPIASTEVPLIFDCTNSDPAPSVVGLNTLLLSASADPVPDIIAVAATLNNDGIVNIPGASGVGVFAVASVNVGTGAMVRVSADTGGATLPMSLSLCETDPGTGVCLSDIASMVTTYIAAGATPSFGIFVNGSGEIPFNPATNRVFVRFVDVDVGAVRGATSVAVRTQ